MLFAITNWTQAAGFTAIGSVGTALVFVKKWLPLVKRGITTVEKIFDHLKQNPAAVQAAQDIEQAATTDNADLRQAKILAAIHMIPQVAGVEYHKLCAPYLTPAITKMVNDHLPELGGVTTEEVTAALQVGATKLASIRSSNLLPMVREMLECIDAAKQVDQKQPQAAQETTFQTA